MNFNHGNRVVNLRTGNEKHSIIPYFWMTTRIDIRLPEQELDRTQTEVIREFIRSLRKKVKNQ